MKTMLVITLSLTLFAASTAVACDSSKPTEAKKAKTASAKKAKDNQSASADQKGGTLLTGSYIKQNIRRSGQITDGANQVIILDRNAVEHSGASDLKQLLTRQGVH